MDLIQAWRNWDAKKFPRVLEDDAAELKSSKWSERIVQYKDWSEAQQDEKFLSGKDNRLHLGLTPMPFDGDLLNASIYILMANPGLSYGDYPPNSDREDTHYDKIRRQEFTGDYLPFMGLDPEYGWGRSFAYWHSRLRKIVERVAIEKDRKYTEALGLLSRRTAVIQRSPYHSKNFVDAAAELPSAQLAREFVNKEIIPRVREQAAVLIIARRGAWERALTPDVKAMKGIVTNTNRSAHISDESDAGKVILKHLQSKA